MKTLWKSLFIYAVIAIFTSVLMSLILSISILKGIALGLVVMFVMFAFDTITRVALYARDYGK